MADWSLPTLTSTYTNFLSQLQTRDTDLALQFDGTTTSNQPTGTIRWDSSAGRWKKWNGTAWAELATTYALTGLSTTGAASVGTTLTVTGATTLTGGGTSTTPATDNNSTNIATTAYVVGQAAATAPVMNGTAAVGTSLRYARQDHVHPTDTTLAPLASPTFTGTVTIPAGASISGFAPLASPTFTGTPAAPTATAGTNTTQVATTAFVTTAVSGVSSGYAPLAGATFTGNVTVQTASQPQYILNSTAIGSWKSNFRFQNSGTAKYEIGVDTAAAGANNFYFYDSVAAVNRVIIDAAGLLKFDSGYGSAAAAYGCRAWVNFDGTTASPSTRRGSGNVSSVTKNGTGDYTLNFTTAMPDANYGVAYGSASITSGYLLLGSSTSPTTTAFRFTTWTTTSLQQDNPNPCVAIFR